MAGAKAAFALATSGVLGLHRDEYYYLACGRHLAWGYVDNPPLVPWLYRATDLVLGDGQLALGIFPALVGAAALVVRSQPARSDLVGGSSP